jgi:hypothetical protein
MKPTFQNRLFPPDYTYTIDDNIIAIVDLDLGNCSVTNDIEFVLVPLKTVLSSARKCPVRRLSNQ